MVVLVPTFDLNRNKTTGIQLHTVSDSKMNQLIMPVNTRETFFDKTYYSNQKKGANCAPFLYLARAVGEPFEPSQKLSKNIRNYLMIL